MKVYVEKLPKECYCCVFNIEDVGGIGGYCIFGGGKKDCPLIPLADYTKQVRKEACNDFKSRLLATCQIEKGCDTASFSLEVLNRILDQIQDKGEKK